MSCFPKSELTSKANLEFSKFQLANSQRVVGLLELKALVRLVNNKDLIVGRVVDKFGTVHSDQEAI